MKKILQKLKSIRLCMEAHPDNEPDSEFADRIEDLKELPKMIEECVSQPKWISVKDRLPEYNVRVLVSGFPTHPTMDGKPTISVVCRREINSFLRVATHWRPLPEGPKQD